MVSNRTTKAGACRRVCLQTPVRRREGGGILSGVWVHLVTGCLYLPPQWVVVTHQSLRGVETAYGSWQQTNKDGSQRDRRHLLQHHRPYLCHLTVCRALWVWSVSPAQSRSFAAMELWDERMWGEYGLYAFSSGCGFLRRQTAVIASTNPFPNDSVSDYLV